jgi:hypothetical protein
MGLLDVLKKKKPRSHDDEVAELVDALGEIVAGRDEANALIASVADRREKLLLEDAPEREILQLESDADEARVRLEKFSLFQVEIEARLDELRADEVEAEWRALYKHRKAAALDYAEALRAAIEKLFALRRVSAACGVNEIGRRYGLAGEAPPILLNGQLLEKFLQDLETLDEYEKARQARRPLRGAEPTKADLAH